MNPIFIVLLAACAVQARPQETGEAEVAERFYPGSVGGYQGGAYPGGVGGFPGGVGGYPGGAYPGAINPGFPSNAPTGIVGTCPSVFGGNNAFGAGIRAKREDVESRFYPGAGGYVSGGSCYTDFDCSGKLICCPFNGYRQCVQPVY